MNVKHVLVELANPLYAQISNNIVNGYFEYIDTSICIDHGVDRFYADPYVTVIHDIKPLGHNLMYHILKIENRDLYKDLKSNKLLKVDDIKLDTIDKEDYKVLRINLDECDRYELLKNYHDRLQKYAEVKSDEPYSVNMNITYLKKDTPEHVIREMNEKVLNDSLKIFEITKFVLLSDQGLCKDIQIRN